MVPGGKSGGPCLSEECVLCKWRAMSKESPMRVPSCCVEEEVVVERSCRIGRVGKSVPSICVRHA